ncbi:MAG: phosphatidate cytidylyltransferase, partial [Bacteroidia bacterium]
MALDKKVFLTRTITAVVFAVIFIGSIYFHYLSFISFFIVVLFVGIRELSNILKAMKAEVNYIVFNLVAVFSLPLMIYLFSFIDSSSEIVASFLILIPHLISLRFLFFHKELKVLKGKSVFISMGLMYLIFSIASLISIPVRFDSDFFSWKWISSYDYFKVLGIVFLIWANDTFAYIGGSLIGKNKMMPSVSPGKTWEGTIIGIVFSVFVGLLLNLKTSYGSIYFWPIIGLLVGILSTI